MRSPSRAGASRCSSARPARQRPTVSAQRSPTPRSSSSASPAAGYKSLHEKHSVINDIHDGRAYDADDLSRRVNACLDEMVAVHTVRADTMVDCTDDRVGLSALETLASIKRARASEM